MFTWPSRSNGCPGLFVPLSLSPRIAYVFGSRISPGAGEGEGEGVAGVIGPLLAVGAGIGLLEGGALCGVMMTGAGEPLGAGEAVGSGGGVTAPGEGEATGGTRICGPSGAAGGPTYGEGNGDGDALADAAGEGAAELAGEGEGEGDSALCATC